MIFVITAQTHPQLRTRVVLLFYRMAIPVRSLTMNRVDDARSRLTVDVEAQPEQFERIAANLAKIVHSLSTQQLACFKCNPPTKPRQRQSP